MAKQKINLLDVALRAVFLIANTLFLGVFPSTLVWCVGKQSCPHVVRQILAVVQPSIQVDAVQLGLKVNEAFFLWRTVGMATFGFISGLIVLRFKYEIIRFLEKL